MQRVTINIDMDNNQLLDEEFIKAIEGAAKAKARSIFSATVQEELNRLAEKQFERWNQSSRGRETRLQKAMEEAINKTIEKNIGKINVNTSIIKDKIDEKLKSVDVKIDEMIQYYFSENVFEEHIANAVVKNLAKTNPTRILELVSKGLAVEVEESKK